MRRHELVAVRQAVARRDVAGDRGGAVEPAARRLEVRRPRRAAVLVRAHDHGAEQGERADGEDAEHDVAEGEAPAPVALAGPSRRHDDRLGLHHPRLGLDRGVDAPWVRRPAPAPPPAPAPRPARRRASQLRPRPLLRQVDLRQHQVRLVEQLEHLVAVQLLALDEDVGDVLDGPAVGLDQQVRVDVGLAQQLRRGRALVGSDSAAPTGSAAYGLPPPARRMICRPISS